MKVPPCPFAVGDVAVLPRINGARLFVIDRILGFNMVRGSWVVMEAGGFHVDAKALLKPASGIGKAADAVAALERIYYTYQADMAELDRSYRERRNNLINMLDHKEKK